MRRKGAPWRESRDMRGKPAKPTGAADPALPECLGFVPARFDNNTLAIYRDGSSI
jgi:hypothetical protein